MSDKTIVRFTKAWRSWFAGDVAGFDQETAEALIGGGVATAHSAANTAAASVIKQPQASSQAKAGKDKQANKRGSSAKPDPVTQTPAGSLLPDVSALGAGGEGYGAEPGSGQDDEGGGDGSEGSGSESGADDNGGEGGTDPDDEKP